ncbi:hypothetical protein TNCV_4882211 [Trichonephila clavipes]|nr:hypothetical protein TNCV_4882211 [Trichonephila clavipes]
MVTLKEKINVTLQEELIGIGTKILKDVLRYGPTGSRASTTMGPRLVLDLVLVPKAYICVGAQDLKNDNVDLDNVAAKAELS